MAQNAGQLIYTTEDKNVGQPTCGTEFSKVGQFVIYLIKLEQSVGQLVIC